MQTNKILKVFITHQDNLQATFRKITSTYDTDYVVAVGGCDQDSYEDGVIKLTAGKKRHALIKLVK